MKHSTLAWLVALFALTGASRSFAWDSATRDGVRDMSSGGRGTLR